jgi:hypothetical protein
MEPRCDVPVGQTVGKEQQDLPLARDEPERVDRGHWRGFAVDRKPCALEDLATARRAGRCRIR